MSIQLSTTTCSTSNLDKRKRSPASVSIKIRRTNSVISIASSLSATSRRRASGRELAQSVASRESGGISLGAETENRSRNGDSSYSSDGGFIVKETDGEDDQGECIFILPRSLLDKLQEAIESAETESIEDAIAAALDSLADALHVSLLSRTPRQQGSLGLPPDLRTDRRRFVRLEGELIALHRQRFSNQSYAVPVWRQTVHL